MFSGCSIFGASGLAEPSVEYFAALMPESWKALDDLYPVNIDGDADQEYLLFYTYDSGQVGGVIYDIQRDTRFVPQSVAIVTVKPGATPGLLPIPNQPSGLYVPFRLLPSYWSGAGQGFISRPGHEGNILVATLYDEDAAIDNPSATGDGNQTDATPTSTPDEDAPVIHNQLVIRGDANRITTVWWRNSDVGYGVAQIAVPSSITSLNGEDWEEWQEDPTPIEKMTGYEPLNDINARSYMCRKIVFSRTVLEPRPTPDEDQAQVYHKEIVFKEEDQGIHYCDGKTVASPFYPEATVLTFLLNLSDDDTKHERLLTSSTSITTLQNIIGNLNVDKLTTENVNDVQSYLTVPRSRVNVPTNTSVCVELQNRQPAVGKRWFIFTLLHDPPGQTSNLSDRWLISGVQEQHPVATKMDADFCKRVIDLPPS